jgi:hypothetical protein
VPDEGTELFDDLYLGVRAGGAMAKQRRGEPLTMEEEAALGRWQRLSSWRKGRGGAFRGTFGLGFTLGGLVFGRGRGSAIGASRTARPPVVGPAPLLRRGTVMRPTLLVSAAAGSVWLRLG